MINKFQFFATLVIFLFAEKSAFSKPTNIITIPIPQTESVVSKDTQGVAQFSNAGFSWNSGVPGLPIQTVSALLPPNADVTTVNVSVQDQSFELLADQWEVLPVPPVMESDGNGPIWPKDRQIINGRDINIYSTDSFFPLSNLIGFSSGQQREWLLVDITISPYQYDPVSKLLKHVLAGNLVITYDVISNKKVLIPADDDFSKEIKQKIAKKAINFSTISSQYSSDQIASSSSPSSLTASASPATAMAPACVATPTTPSHYIIMTTKAIKNIATKLPDFIGCKQQQGFAVEVITEETWGGGTGNSAAENLRKWLQANWHSHNIGYVLLIGNPDANAGDVPMKTLYPDGLNAPLLKDYPTDFYYAELDGNWDFNKNGVYGEARGDVDSIPANRGVNLAWDVVVGRIPYYNNANDLNNILSKITAYENAPASGQDWRKKSLLAMYPIQDTTHDGTLGYPLGEEIKNQILVPNYYSYYRVYKDVYNLNPPPEKLGVTFDNVTNAWNSAHPGTVFYWGLGFFVGSQVQVSCIMDVNHAALLSPSYPSFVFGVCGYDASPEKSDNISYSILKTGGFLTIGGTRLTFFGGGLNSNFAHKTFSTGICFDYSNQFLANAKTAGMALQDVKKDLVSGSTVIDQYSLANYYAFNIYGDPSAKLTTTQTPPNLALGKFSAASSVKDATSGPEKAFDGTISTQWTAASGKTANEWLQIDFGINTTYNKVILSENGNSISGYKIQNWNGSWNDVFTGTTIGPQNTITLGTTVGSKVRIYITGASQSPSINEFEVYNLVPQNPKVCGVAFGTSPPWTSGYEFNKATDGNTTTYFDYSQPNGGYTGIDLGPGNNAKIIKIRFFPRTGYESRMNGGKFQGSNVSSSSGYVDLATITSNPSTGIWTEIAITDPTTYRYLRYLGPNNGYCNIAEMEFYKENIVNQILSSISVTPASSSMKASSTQQFSGIAKDQFGNVMSPQPLFSWSISCGGGSINTSGLCTAGNSAGTYTVSAANGSISGTATVTITLNVATGSISYEKWTGISGTSTDNIPLTTTPNQTGTFTCFEAPSNIADNYGYRVRGYLVAPQTGTYYFWIASDDNSKLYLNSSGTASSGKQLIASVTGYTNSREWSKFPSQKSCAINLTAGTAYYIEALMKEGTSNDNLAVGWAKPGQSTSCPSEVIPGTVLAPWPAPTTLEAENLTRTSNVSTSVETDAKCSNGKEVKVSSTKINDYVQLTIPSVIAGAYNVKVYYKSMNTNGILQASFDGVNQGATVDQYAATSSYGKIHDLGTATFGTTGNKIFKYVVTGKNASSTGYTMTIDKIILTPQ